MRKRILTALLSLCVALTLLPTAALAARVTDSGTCGSNLTWTLDDAGTLTISGTGWMDDSSAPWHGQAASIKKVIIESGVTSISGYAFQNCISLTSVTIPDGVTAIGRGTFQNCHNLTSITIPDSITGIGSDAFSYCTALTDVHYSGTKVQWGAISYGANGNGGEYLTDAAIHCSDGEINEAAATSGACGAGLTWTLDGAATLTISGTGTMDDYNYSTVIPWRGHRFAIKAVVINGGVASIGNNAFCGYDSLTSVTIPNSVTSIGAYAFGFCDSLTSVIIPNSVTSIGRFAFSWCKNLTSAIISNSVTSIEDDTFLGCSSLTNVTIPVNVTSIGDHAFRDSLALTDVYYSGTKAQWGAISISTNNEPLTKAIIHCSDGVINSGTDTPAYTYKITKPMGVENDSGSYDVDTKQYYTFDLVIDAPPVELITLYIDDAAVERSSGSNTNYSVLTAADGGTDIQIDGSYLSRTYAPGAHTIAAEFWEGGTGGPVHRPTQNFVLLPASYTILSEGTAGIPYSLSLAKDGASEYAFSRDFPAPAGLTLNRTTGLLSGTPLKAGTWYFGVERMFTDKVVEYFKLTVKNAPALPGGVKYVPYSQRAEEESFTETQDDPGWEELYYELVGTLPSGLSLDSKTAEISGVPIASGTWNFQVKRILPHPEIGPDAASVLALPWSLTIASNTDTAVKQPNDYPIDEPIGTQTPGRPDHFYKDSYEEDTLKIDGPLLEFIRLLIDGEVLTRDVDYTAVEGSTVITIRSQTFQRFGEGTHTIAAEFREGGTEDGALKRVAQNYTLTLSRPASGNDDDDDDFSPGVKKPGTKKPGTALPFTDVSPSDWFYEDLVWAYQEGVMLGVSNSMFAPQRSVSQATIVTVLARLAKVDLSRFEDEEEPGIPSGQSYTAAAIWARRAGMLPVEGAFTGNETTSRNQMAVMLMKYLLSMGKDTTLPAEPVSFADAEAMTQEGNDAFQVLYRYGIFRGVGGLRMDPSGSTTRAHFVALIHRIYTEAMS